MEINRQDWRPAQTIPFKIHRQEGPVSADEVISEDLLAIDHIIRFVRIEKVGEVGQAPQPCEQVNHTWDKQQ